MNEEKLLEDALAYIHPPIPKEQQEAFNEALLELARTYKRTGRLRVVMEPMKRIGESDEAHEARVVEHIRQALKRRGRPANRPQEFLVFGLRDLLHRHHCNYGVLKNGDTSNLVHLALLIDLFAGKPRGDVDWQFVAEKCADPLYGIELATGSKLQASPEVRTEAKRNLSKNIRKHKRGNT